MNKEVTLFEILPNEILIQCFKYLNAVDILHSFDRLNYRFYLLIHGLPLYVNFHDIKKCESDGFCSKMISNPNIKNQIYSIELSNVNSCQIHDFLTLFPLTEFINLRSLTLIEVRQHNVSQLRSQLALLIQLTCFRLIDYQAQDNQLPSSRLQILQTPFLFSNNHLLCDISSIQNLTIVSCSTKELNQILLSALKLEYLNVEYVSSQKYSTEIYDRIQFERNRAIHVRKLIFMEFSDDFSELVMVLNQTPNLKDLTVCTQISKSLFDAQSWQDLISSSLPNLRIFNFKFDELSGWVHDDIQQKFVDFQTDFWRKEHRWFTRCMLIQAFDSIYSIPYVSNQFSLTSYTKMYEDNEMISKNEFDKVNDLIIDPSQIEKDCQYKFSHVNTLQIGDPSLLVEQSVLYELHIKFLSNIVNLRNIKTLRIASNCKIQTSTVLLTILKQTPNISFLGIEPNLLIPLTHDENLCGYLRKMIQSLDLTTASDSDVPDMYEMNSIWTTFSDITHLRCRLTGQRSIVFLFEKLSKLLRFDFKIGPNTILGSLFHFEIDIEKKLGIKIISESIYEDELIFFNWIIRNNK